MHCTAPQPLNKVKEDSNGKSITHYDGKSNTDKARCRAATFRAMQASHAKQKVARQ
ncbi:MAG: hypothetical protein GY821_13100 [Gammaproteobacteria bacterium]|nr:hypothetical protein [Gammaproteobacteria bacterium]